MEIVQYPHPALRRRSKPIRRVDAELRNTVRQMFDLMYEARGVGLAANQVDLPVRLFVVNPKGDPGDGEEMVFINPVISMPKGVEEAEEGCLSLPKLYGDVVRPKQVKVQAYTLEGREYNADVGGLLARIIQHELDHLDGVLFVDRLSETGKMAAAPVLAEFDERFAGRLKRGEIPSLDEIEKRFVELEHRYC